MPKKPFRHPLKALRRFLRRKPAAGKKKLKAPLEDEVETRAEAARTAKAARARAKKQKDKDAEGRKKAGKKDGKKGKKKSRAPRPGLLAARGGFAVPPLAQGVPTRPPTALDLPVQSLLRAASFAARKHMGQKRADGVTPYFSHVSRVTLVLSHVFGVRDEELLTAALLHDTLEDTATDYDEIEDHFGARVADMVVLLTKNNMMPKDRREDEYAARLIAAPEPVKIAKMADIYDNLSDRVTSLKILKTTATAERLLRAFGPQLVSPTGIAAHAKTSDLLARIKAIQLETPPAAL